MSSNDIKVYHFLFTTLPFWGHTRAPCILAARMVKEHKNLIVTLIVASNYLKNAEVEIAAEFDSGEVSHTTRQRVRFLSICKPHPTAEFGVQVMALFQSYPSAYKAFMEAKPVTCATTGKVIEAVVAPSALFLDIYASALTSITRAITGSAVPVIAVQPVHASFLLHLHGPEEMGGNGDLGAKIDAEAARLGITTKELGDKVFLHAEGKINKVPGLPPMYDWEHFPQKLPTDEPVSDFLRYAYEGFKTCDAAFSLSSYDFEPASVDALKSWFAKAWNKDVYAVGPLLASKPTKYGVSSNNSNVSSEIEVFLDNSLKKYGPKSLVLLSFGSMFWPTRPDYVEEVIEALIEKKFPFIVSYASPFASISEDLIDRVNSTRAGLISKWIPQKFVLNHPATGWFISHAGQSSVLESLDSGIPMICWPFKFDQPPASAYISECLNAAFELVEVRTGEHGDKPLFRNGRKPQGTREAVGAEIRAVLEACRGEKGRELRKNAESMKAKFEKSWGLDGASRRDFNAFLNKFGIRLLHSASGMFAH